MVRRDTDGDHVFLDVLAEMNASIEALRDNVSSAVVRRNIEHYVGIPAYQFADLGRNGGRRQARYKETYATCGLSLVVGDSLQTLADFNQGRTQSRQQLLASVRERYGTCSARNEAHAYGLFKRPYGMTDRRRRDALPLCGFGETSFFCDGDKGSERSEVSGHHL